MNTRSSKEYWYIFITTWKQASTSHRSSRLTTRASSRLRSRLFSPWLSLSYLILYFRVANFLFANSQNTTAFHYRYDMGMYCTLVLFVNQHFPGLPASGTTVYVYIHGLSKSRLGTAEYAVNISSDYNGSLVTWTVIRLAAAKFQPDSHPTTVFKSKLYYDRRSVGQSALVSGTHLGLSTNFSPSFFN
jgi:hypothetical protein